MPDSPVSVIIVTHNRRELLCKAIHAACKQSLPVEVFVMDDASTDGTDQMMAAEFPHVHYYKTPVSRGPAFLRNLGAEKATSDIIFFFDDDTLADDPTIVARTLLDFSAPDIGAVAIPFINVLQDNEVQTGAPDTTATYVYHAFVAAAFAIRRSVFTQLGGFRKEYFYMGEEGDLCIRLLAAGYYVKAGTSRPAFHFQPPKRISFAADFYGRRNDILFLYLNAPRLYLFANLVGSLFKGLWFGIRVKRLTNMLKGASAGLGLMFDARVQAQVRPVQRKVYQKYRYLKHHEPLRIDRFAEKA